MHSEELGAVRPEQRCSESRRDWAQYARARNMGVSPPVSDLRRSLCVWPTCGWHSVMGEQPVSSQSADASADGVEQRAARPGGVPRRPFRRLIRADRERPATLWRP